ncbi:MAG: HAMP domain-containing histidine kinase [Elusimicrobia bacterium]|nr:HAMP domain-containing histidine kinase [Elusimicrobiota bacterium]
MTIRAKLGLLVSGLLTAAIAAAGAAHYASQRRARLAEAEGAAERAAGRLAAAAESAVRAKDPARLGEAFAAAAKDDRLLWAAVIRPDGSAWWRQAAPGVVEAVNQDGVSRALSVGRTLRFLHEGECPAVEFVRPLAERLPVPSGAGSRARIPALRAGFDARALRADAAAAASGDLRRLWWPAAIGLLLGLAGAHWLAGSITRTLRKLAEGAQAVGAGHFSMRVRTRREDELRDLTEEFNDMGRRLAELERLKDSFLAKVTHDLRNPLGAIVSFADLLTMGAQGPLSKAQRQALDTISKSAAELAGMVDEILELTELEAGRARFKPADFEVRPLADEVLALYAAKAGELGVALDAGGVAEDAMVRADRQALRRVLSNLVSNALKFTPKGGRVSVRLEHGAEDVLSVHDTGVGIPTEHLPRLFEKFYQVEETKHRARHAKGTGLGLAICREIAEGHGGRVWAESEYGKGAAFFVALPAAGARAAQARERPGAEKERRGDDAGLQEPGPGVVGRE